ncbi:MAG: rRNA maturation RNase YbeY [Desulfomonilaceae bacterium]
MEILIDWRRTEPQTQWNQLRQRAEQILQDLGCVDDSILSVTVVDSEVMAEINLTYRGKEGPTNVLSFRQKEAGLSSGDPNLLGDVVICWDRVVSDSQSLGYTMEEMFMYLLIHGILHIVGFDHDSSGHAQTMENKVNQIFEKFFPSADDLSS